jgi:predicted DCC family thiol-disulfide oxidoreductase YuxK
MKVIFFDGVCGLCNGFVDFIMKIDKNTQFKFSPLQSGYASQKLPSHYTQNMSSVVYMDQKGQIFSKSEAVIRIMKDMGGIWNIAIAGKILPDFLLNKAYDFVAENRYKVFGKKETCRLPTSEERARFVIDINEDKLRP